MPSYSVSMVGRPTSLITTEKRTFTVRFRICTAEDECDLFPAVINSTVILYDDAPCPPEDVTARPIPAFYDLTFYGCPKELDAGAVLVSSSLVDEKVDPSQADLDELKALTDGLPEVPCVACALYEFVYEADLVDGKTEVGDIAENACPEITIEPYVVSESVEKATFKGFWTSGDCCEDDCGCDDGTNDCLEACSDSIWSLFRDNNWPPIEGLKECIAAAKRSYDFDMAVARQARDAQIEFCKTLTDVEFGPCVEEAEAVFGKRVTELWDKRSKAGRACLDEFDAQGIESAPCWSLISGECGTPRNPNGVPLNLETEATEEVVTIRHYAEDTGPVDLFRRVTNTVNCTPFSVAIPCQNFYMTWPSRTLHLRFVRHSSTTLNGSRVWIREYQFHYKKTGWDEFVKVDGVERAVCVDAPEGANVYLEFDIIAIPDTENTTVSGDATDLLNEVVEFCDAAGENCGKEVALVFSGANAEAHSERPLFCSNQTGRSSDHGYGV